MAVDLQRIADELAAEVEGLDVRRRHLQRALDELALLGIEPGGASAVVEPVAPVKPAPRRPITVAEMSRVDRAREAAKVRVACEVCGREFSQMGIEMHRRSHGGGIMPKPPTDEGKPAFTVDDALAAIEGATA